METFHTPAPINAVVDVSSGDVRINASDRSDTTVSVVPRDRERAADVQAASNTSVNFVNGILTVSLRKSWQRFTGPGKRDGSVLVTIELPSGSTLSASTGFGFVHCEGELANAVAKSGMGDLRVDRVATFTAKTGFGDVIADVITGDANVKTGTGSIRLGTVEGTTAIKNANGIVSVERCAHAAHIRTASGNIAIGQAQSSLTAGSAAGDIRIAEVSTGSVSARTGAGAIEIGIREGASAWLDVASKFGSVRNGLTTATAPEPSNSTVEVRAQTGAGDIVIHRAQAA